MGKWVKIDTEVEIDIEDYYDDIPDADIEELYKERFDQEVEQNFLLLAGGNGISHTALDTVKKLNKLFDEHPLWFNDLMDDIRKLQSYKDYVQ